MDELMASHIGAFMLGQLTISLSEDEAVLAGPGPCPIDTEVVATPEAIREWVRIDALGRYRPLSGARTLRPNWHATFATLAALDEAIEAVYPLAQAHIAAWDEGALRVVGLDEVLARQTGRYRPASSLSQEGRDLASSLLCAGCVRVPVWRRDYPAAGEIPCPEPCSVLVSYCREAVSWEEEHPAPRAIDPLVPIAAFEQPGNALRETYLSFLESRCEQ